MDNYQSHWVFFLNFSLNSAKSVTKILIITVKGLEPGTFCARDPPHDSASKTHVRDTIFKLNPIHASVIYRIP